MSYDRDRYERDRYDRDRYDRDRTDRDWQDRDRYGRSDRGPVARATDEVRSWFGDDDAQRRRERDDRDNDRWNRDDRWRGTSSSTDIDRDRDRSREYGYARGSQEFGPEGYGAPVRYSRFGTGYGQEGSSYRQGYAQSTERWRVPGPFVGRGPRGYQRSEERIREEINDRLTAHGLLDASDVNLQIQNGEVTLTGFVDSREAKRAAEDCAEDVSGVREVHNHLRIRSHADDTGVGRTSVLGLTEQETQNAATARQADAANRSRSRNP